MKQTSDDPELQRAARHLIQCHDSRAVQVALKRALYLDECAEPIGADTWRKIARIVGRTTARPVAG